MYAVVDIMYAVVDIMYAAHAELLLCICCQEQ